MCFLIHVVPVQDSTSVETNDTLLLPTNKTIVKWSPDSVIKPHLQETFAVTNGYDVDISLYFLNLSSMSYVFIEKLANDVPNNGMYEITVPSVNPENFTVITGIIGISLSEQYASQPTLDDFTKIPLQLLKKASKFGIFYIRSSKHSRGLCSTWRLSEPEDIGKTLLNRLPPCPPNRGCAENDLDFTEDNFLLSFLHPGASSCFRQTRFTR